LNGYPPVEFDLGHPVAATVGQTIALRAHAYSVSPGGPVPSFTWGVLEGDRARIDAGGHLTVTAPGPIHVFIEANHARRYLLIAGKSDAPGIRELPVWLPDYSSSPWSSLLQDRTAWDRFWQAMPGATSASPPPLPPEMDFEKQSVLAMGDHLGDGEQPPSLTEVANGTIELTVPHTGQSVGIERWQPYVSVFLLPKQPDDVKVHITRLNVNATGPLPLVPPTGPTPTPSPSPTPTPDPNETTQPGEVRPGPPYGPPTPPPAGGCPPADMFWANANPRPLTLRWADAAPSGPAAAPWQPILRVGESTRLATGTIAGQVRWRVADPRLARISADGTLTALHPGAILVTAEAGGATAHALVACVATPDPAIAFHFYRDLDAPADQTPRTTRIFSSLEAWASFWKTSFFYAVPGQAPGVDFATRDVISLVDDRLTWGESAPVLTHVSDNGTVPHIVFPGIEGMPGMAYGRRIYLFQVGKLRPGGHVQVHTLCAP
jgi:hypothetical protein